MTRPIIGQNDEAEEEPAIDIELDDNAESAANDSDAPEASDDIDEEDAVALDAAETADTEDDQDEVVLTPEAEADLMAELAEIEMEEDPELDENIGKTVRSDRVNRSMDENPAENEEAVERLMEETNAKLETSESKGRRSAISHLRAAVAATIADRKFGFGGRKEKQEEEIETYRSDLADVVTPSRPATAAEKHSERPAPLVLVSEQRIDESDEDAAPETPAAAEQPETPVVVRPRRISKEEIAARRKAAEEAGHKRSEEPFDAGLHDNAGDTDADEILASSTSFADFAEKMGATELPDLLEAAAAYTAYIEGQPHFARPQLLRRVADFTGKKEFNREEGLRSFGQLLRQGKIVKVKRGQFEISESTRFKPEARFAGE